MQTRADASWDSQLDLTAAAPSMEDVLELDYEDDNKDTSELLISEEDKVEDDIFIPSAQAAKPGAVAATRGEGKSMPASHAPRKAMWAVCKRVPRLHIPRPEVVTEITRSRH